MGVQQQEDVLFLDTETELFTPGNLTPRVVCFSFWSASWADGPTLFNAEEGLDCLEEALDSRIILGGHNLAYDFGVSAKARPSLMPKIFRAYDEGRVRDTGIRQKLIDIEAGMRSNPAMVMRRGEWVPPDFSLAGKVDEKTGKVKGKGLVWYYLGKDRSADKGSGSWRKRYGELIDVPLSDWPPEAVRYALEDAEDTGRVFYCQAPGVLVNEREQVYAAWALHLVSAFGMLTDKDDVEFLESWATPEWKKVQEKMLAEGLFKIVPLSAEDKRKGKTPDLYVEKTKKIAKKNGGGEEVIQVPSRFGQNEKAIQERVQKAFEAQGREIIRTPSGEVKCDRDTLEHSGDPLLEELAGVGPVATVLKTFMPTLKQGIETPINTSFNVILESGRISSFKPNLNNVMRSLWSDAQKKELKKKVAEASSDEDRAYYKRLLNMGVRECFKPRPGYAYVSADYDCAELRSWAQVCYWLFGASDLKDFFNNDPNGDPHLALAASVLGISYEEALARKKEGDPEIMKYRQGQKPVNFGYPGGLGPDKMADSARKSYGVIMSREDAVQSKQQWFGRWREGRDYLGHINRTVGMGGATIMQLRPGGLPHRKRGNVGYTDGANTLFQGLTADGAKEALCRVSKECYVDCGTALFGCRIVIFLYDELIIEAPIDRVHEAAKRLVEVMIEGMRMWLPDVPVVASPVASLRWCKSAKAVFDQDKRLIPWVPAS